MHHPTFLAHADIRLNAANIWSEDASIGANDESSDCDGPEGTDIIGDDYPGASGMISRKDRENLAPAAPSTGWWWWWSSYGESGESEESLNLKVTEKEKTHASRREVAWSKDSYGQRLAVTVNLKGAQMPRYAQPSSRKRSKKGNNRKKKKKSRHGRQSRGRRVQQ